MKKILFLVFALGLFHFSGAAQGVFERVSNGGEPDSVSFAAKGFSERSTYEGAWTAALMQAFEQCLQGINADDVATSVKADRFLKHTAVMTNVSISVEKTPQGTFKAICFINGTGVEETISVSGSKE